VGEGGDGLGSGLGDGTAFGARRQKEARGALQHNGTMRRLFYDSSCSSSSRNNVMANFVGAGRAPHTRGSLARGTSSGVTRGSSYEREDDEPDLTRPSRLASRSAGHTTTR
jgi:hypothetical protein